MFEQKSRDYHFLITRNKVDPFLTMQVQGFMEGRNFRENTLNMLRLLKKHKLTKVLVDTRNMTLISYADRVWLESLFIPYAIEEGFRKACFLNPYQKSGKQSLENVISGLPGKFHSGFFSNREKAVSWLNSFDD